MNLTRKNQGIQEKPVLVPLGPPQIPHGLNRDQTPNPRGERPATKRHSHGTTVVLRLGKRGAIPLLKLYAFMALTAINLPFFVFEFPALQFTQANQLFKDEAYLFYIRTQCVPRCKHSPLRL
jgi:hypothetical protein